MENAFSPDRLRRLRAMRADSADANGAVVLAVFAN